MTTKLAKFAEAVPKKHKRCWFCKMPPLAHKELRELLDKRKTGEWSHISIPKAVGYFRTEYKFAGGDTALWNHVTTCLGEQWG